MLKDDGLKAYADLLASNGFAIYEPTGTSGDYFLYSRDVDGRECFGYVHHEYFGGYSHTMPIRPSRENGSSMFVAGVGKADTNEGSYDVLTVEAAKTVARPTNRNRLVGTQQNYEDPAWIQRGYVRR